MTSSLPPSGSAKARLERRSQAVARLRHPNLVRMLSLPGGAGLSPVLGDARRLADFTLPAGTFKRFELEQVVRLLLDVLSGVSALHEVVTDGESFVHGEVCPQHVYVDQHGTARLVPLVNTHLTGSSRPEHTGYLAPERLAGEPLDGRADVFSVGVMLWEALAGQRLFPEPTLAAVRARLAQPLSPRLSPRERWAEPLCALALRAIADDPRKRFQTALDFSHALATAAAQRLSRVDTDAWQEEAPTPVFQPRLHLPRPRTGRTPPPLPVVSPRETSGPDTAPPTTSEEQPSLAPAPARRSRGRSALAALAVVAAAAAGVAAYRLPGGWQRWLTAPSVPAESSSLRVAAAPFAAPKLEPAAGATPASAFAPAATPAPETAVAPAPSVVPLAPSVASAPSVAPLGAPSVEAAPPSASPPPARPAAPFVPPKPKEKPARDYGI